MNKNNYVIEKINVGLHNEVFRGANKKPTKANKNLQELILSLNFRLVSLFYSVCQHCLLELFFKSVSIQRQLNVLQRKNISSLCLHECA